MKEEYDFSKVERGKFHDKEARLALPIYLEPEAAAFSQKMAIKKVIDVNTIVNDWIKKDIAVIESVL